MAALFFPLLAILLRIAPALAAVPRFGAVDHATLLPGASVGDGIASRWYMQGTPALPAQPVSPNPRAILDAQRSNPCGPGTHSCVEVGAPAQCCSNDRYCYLDEDWQPMCCGLGVKCPGSRCDSDTLYCNATSSVTVAVPVAETSSSSGQQSSNMVTSVVSRTTFAACCARPCSAGSFSCEQLYGGQCCSYGYKCLQGGSCLPDPVPSTGRSISSIVPLIPTGCTTSQFSCAATEGGGCCDTGFTCAFQSIAPATSTPVCAPNLTVSDDGSLGGLSTGAKAGIGVGVAVGAAIAIAAVTWLCLRRRRESSRATGTNLSAHEMRAHSGINGSGRQTAGGMNGDPDQGDSLFVGPQTPQTLLSGFTDDAALSRPGYNYIGPDAIAGPFTVRDSEVHPAFNPELATTPPAGLPLGDNAPYHPDHIRIPVEIGGKEAQQDMERDKEVGPLIDDDTPDQDEDHPEGPFELMGSLATPSPLNSDGTEQPTDKGPSPPPTTSEGPK